MRYLPIVAVAALATAAHAGAPALSTEVYLSGINNPTYLTFAPGDPDRVFVLEQGGKVRVAVNGVLQATPFLDIDALVPIETFNGLLGIAFDPDYQTNGYFYLHHPLDETGGSASDRIAVARYTVTANPNVADPGSRHIILEMNYPSLPGHHVGGWLGFGPNDGYLYMTFGDGGTTGQETFGGERAQSLSSAWGKVLRVDPGSDDFPGDADRNYAIPASNPFVGQGGDEAVWALGLRQPFRCDFDNDNGDFWIADVGLFAREEFDYQRGVSPGGENYGWNCAEGTLCSSNGNCTCGAGLRGPVHEYAHTAGACSLSGGAIYRGCAIDGLSGTYFYGDWCNNALWSFDAVFGSVSNVTNRTAELNPGGQPTITNITGISEDYYGELYICSQNDNVYRIIPAGGVVDDNDNGIADLCEADKSCPGDTNGDNTVNVDDLNNVILDWGTDGSANGGDVTGALPGSPPDGIVDVNDLNAVIVGWGDC